MITLHREGGKFPGQTFKLTLKNLNNNKFNFKKLN